MTKAEFTDYFESEVLPMIRQRYEQDGVPDRPARREAWNDTVDAMISGGQLPASAGNWGIPDRLETRRSNPVVRFKTKHGWVSFAARGTKAKRRKGKKHGGPRNGRVPPQLRPYLFKAKHRRGKKHTAHHRAKKRRRTNPKRRSFLGFFY